MIFKKFDAIYSELKAKFLISRPKNNDRSQSVIRGFKFEIFKRSKSDFSGTFDISPDFMNLKIKINEFSI